MAINQRDQIINIQQRYGHLCFLQQVFEMSTKIIFAHICYLLGVPHYLTNFLIPHVRGKVFRYAYELRYSAWLTSDYMSHNWD